MIDLHSHILPDLDDGASSWEEAVQMCSAAFQDGTRTMVATPHVFNGIYSPKSEQIEEKISELKNRLFLEGIDLEIVQGAEVHVRPDLPLLMSEDPILTFNGKGRYFLLEFPHSVIPPNADQFIFKLMTQNLIPVIAHPERNLSVQSRPEILEPLVKQGALTQVTAMSFTGGFGPQTRDVACELLRRNLVHVVASDAHNSRGRPPLLSDARKRIIDLVGFEKSRELFEVFPRKILEGAL